MPDVVFAIPGDLGSPTGGYAYDRRLLELLPAHGLDVSRLALPDTFPHPSPEDIDATRRALAALPAQSVVFFDGLAYGALPREVIAATSAPIVALVHHPLGYETGLPESRRKELLDSERAALALARKVIVSSPTTRDVLEIEFGVPATRIAIAEPGAERVPRARGSAGTPTILAVGAVSPRKGYDVLVDALARIAGRSWRAVIAGTLDQDRATAAHLRAQIGSRGLGGRIALAGTVSDTALAELYATADVFVVSSIYEGYGMALADAMSYGLAIVSTTGGAAAHTVPDGAALKVPPGDAHALAQAIATMLDQPDRRRALADAARQAGQQLPSWDDTAAVVAHVLRSIA
ncbi:MAG: glycosyltransferase family 4 protein [Gemmatimonas sp.]